MAEISDLANEVYADGPVGSEINPQKDEIRDLFAAIDAAIAAVVTNRHDIDPVRVVVTTNVVLATACENGDTLNGIVLATGDRIGPLGQTLPAQNGIYVVQASGAPVRATDADSSAELVGATFYVREGTLNRGTTWACTTPATIVVGTTALTFALVDDNAAVVPATLDSLRAKGTDVAAAATLNLDTATGDLVDVTGSTTITAVTLSAGRERWARFTGTPQITVGASLIGNNGGSNIVAAAGDIAVFKGYAAGVVRFVLYRVSGKSVSPVTSADLTDLRDVNLTPGGTATAITATGSPTQTAYSADRWLNLVPPLAPTGPTTVNVDAVGIKHLLWADGSFIESGDYLPLRLLELRLDSASDSLRIIRPERKDPSVRLGHKASQGFTVAQSGMTSVATRYSTADVGDGYSFTSVFASTLSILKVHPHQLLAGDTLVAEMTPSGTIVTSSAVAIGVSAHLPVADNDVLQTNSVIYSWRSDGTVNVVSDNGSTQLQAVTTTLKWETGDVLRMELFRSADGLGGMLTLYNGGNAVGSFATTQRAIGYAMVGMRSLGAGYIVTVNKARVRRQNNLVKSFYLNGSALSSGAGDQPDVPFMSIKDAMSEISGKGDSLRLYLKNSFRGALEIPVGRHKEIILIGDPANRPSILGSSQYTSGWTKTGGFTNVYERPAQWGQKLLSYINGGIVEVTAAVNHAVGRSGAGRTIPIMPYTRQSPNTLLATLDGTPGASMVDTTANKMYVHARGSVSPNTLTLEYSEVNYCIAFTHASDADYHPLRITIDGIDCRYAYGSNIMLRKASVKIVNVGVYGSVVNAGLSVDDCSGDVDSLYASGNRGDGLNHSSVAGSVGYTWPNKLQINDYNAFGNLDDGASNHGHAVFNFRGGSMIANGSRGWAAADGGGSALGMLFQDNVGAGILAMTDNDHDLTLDARSCTLKGNNIGIQAYANTAVPTKGVVVNSTLNIFDTNITSSLNALAAATFAAKAVINSVGDQTVGAAPSGGHKVIGDGGSFPTGTIPSTPVTAMP